MHPLRPMSVKLGELYAARSGTSLLDLSMTLDSMSKKCTIEQISEAREHLMLLMMIVGPRTRRLFIAKHLAPVIFIAQPLEFPQLLSLDIQVMTPSIPNNVIRELFPFVIKAPKLRELGLWNQPMLMPEALQHNLGTLPYSAITTLRLTKCTIRTLVMTLLHCTQVVDLELVDVYGYDANAANDVEDMDWGMYGLLNGVLYSPSLRSLKVDVVQQVMQTLLHHTQFPNLQDLYVRRGSAALMHKASAAPWSPTLRSISTLSMGGAIPKQWPPALQSVKDLRLLDVKKLTGKSLRTLVDLFPDSVEVLQIKDDVVWERD